MSSIDGKADDRQAAGRPLPNLHSKQIEPSLKPLFVLRYVES